WRGVLNIVIDREDRLRWIRDFRSADLFELWNDRAGVVVRHHVTRPDGNEIARAHDLSLRKSIRMSRRNFLNQRQTHPVENYFLLARLPRSLAISKSTKSA